MTFTLRLTDDYLRPAIICDRCGADVSASGFQLWHAPGERSGPLSRSSVQLCGDDCLEAWMLEREDGDEWLALPIDAYLANLVGVLGIDTASVLQREQAVWAAEHTRHEAPD